jgi:phosphatidylserine/phosphatidylglycerophosphate/cardiolipin synthase-like enzyme
MTSGHENMMDKRHPLLYAIAFACLAGCTTLPAHVERTPSHAFDAPAQTFLGRSIAAIKHPEGTSGFQVLASGDVAYEARMALIDRAERSIDLQYFIVREDATTRALVERVLSAAARGVRVRFLVDDLYTTKDGEWLASLAAHTNVDVRLFNPFPGGRHEPLVRLVGAIGDFQQLTRRMHNKLFIVDGAVAICGGRNLANEYYARNGPFNFADLDVLAAGPIVRTLGRSFDLFWNNDLSYPVEAFGALPPPRPRDGVAQAAKTSRPADPAPGVLALRASLLAGKPDLIWARARALSDRPDKAHPQSDGEYDSISADVLQILGNARRELLIISPYFVPGDGVMLIFAELRKRGVAIRVLTNSLATNDVPAAHAGYARRRPELLRLGVELHEFKPSPDGEHTEVFGDIARSRASLHAKAMVVDRSLAFVGSMNIDPRSAKLDTENGIIVSSPVLAEQIAAVFEHGADESASFLVRDAGNGSPQWVAREGDETRTYTEEPETELWTRILAEVLKMAAPEDQL